MVPLSKVEQAFDAVLSSGARPDVIDPYEQYGHRLKRCVMMLVRGLAGQMLEEVEQAMELPIMARLREAKTMPELDAMRLEVLRAAESDGTKETFEKVQNAFRSAKNRLERIPLREREGW